MFAPIQLSYGTPLNVAHPAPQHNERPNKVYRVLLHSENGTSLTGGDGGNLFNDPLEFDIQFDDLLLDKSNYQMALESFIITYDDTQNTTPYPFAIKVDGLAIPNSYDTKTKTKSNILFVGNIGDGQTMIYNRITPDTYGIPIGNLDIRKLKVQLIKALDYTIFTDGAGTNPFGNTHGRWIIGLIFYPIK